MLPVISTRELSNFELTLSPDGTRVGNHKCSNLLDYTEVKTHHGFLTDATKNPDVIGETIPYQYSPTIRGSNTLRFYRNLNLEACLWEFSSYYDMSELLTDCGGTIGTDGQVSTLILYRVLVIKYYPHNTSVLVEIRQSFFPNEICYDFLTIQFCGIVGQTNPSFTG